MVFWPVCVSVQSYNTSRQILLRLCSWVYGCSQSLYQFLGQGPDLHLIISQTLMAQEHMHVFSRYDVAHCSTALAHCDLVTSASSGSTKKHEPSNTFLLGASVQMQEIYCFVLPFIVKWVVAALVVSVLVNLFSRLRQQGDHARSSVVTQVHGLLLQWWQRMMYRAPSSQNMLLSLIKLNGRGSAFKAMPSFIRYYSQLIAICLPHYCNGHGFIALCTSVHCIVQ